MWDEEFDSDLDTGSDVDCDVDDGGYDLDDSGSDLQVNLDESVDFDLADVEPAEPADLDLDAEDFEEPAADLPVELEDAGDLADGMALDEVEVADLGDPEEEPSAGGEISDELLEAWMQAEQEGIQESGEEDVKVLRRDPDELMETGMQNVEEILDVRRDDMMDKGMSEEEIEQAIAQEREALRWEFVQDAFPERFEAQEPEELEMEETADLAVKEENDTEEVTDLAAAQDLDLEQDEADALETESEELDETADTGLEGTQVTDADLEEETEPEDDLAEPLEEEEISEPLAEELSKTELEDTALPEDVSDEEEEAPDLMRELVRQNVQDVRLPREGGTWADPAQAGEGLWIPDDDAELFWKEEAGGSMTGAEFKQRYGVEGVTYRDGEPDFEPFEDELLGHVELEEMPTERTGAEGSYAAATRAAADRLGISEQEVEQRMEERGLTWHECGDRRTVRAIPTEVNAAFPHTGGISIQRGVRAMAEELADRYGTVRLDRNGPAGTTEGLTEARGAVRREYRGQKRKL